MFAAVQYERHFISGCIDVIHSSIFLVDVRTGLPWAQCLCQRCDLHALDERHLVVECPAMQCADPALFSPALKHHAAVHVQRDIVGSAHQFMEYFLMCLVPLLLMMHQPWRLLLDRCNPSFTNSFQGLPSSEELTMEILIYKHCTAKCIATS